MPDSSLQLCKEQGFEGVEGLKSLVAWVPQRVGYPRPVSSLGKYNLPYGCIKMQVHVQQSMVALVLMTLQFQIQCKAGCNKGPPIQAWKFKVRFLLRLRSL